MIRVSHVKYAIIKPHALYENASKIADYRIHPKNQKDSRCMSRFKQIADLDFFVNYVNPRLVINRHYSSAATR